MASKTESTTRGLYNKLALGLLLIATMFAWIAYTCTGWGEMVNGAKEGIHYGLWRICQDDKNFPRCFQTDGWANDWYAATQAMVTFGFFGINAALFLHIMYMFKPGSVGSRKVALCTTLVCFITGLFYLIGIIVYGTMFYEDFVKPADSDPNLGGEYKLSYCYVLSVVALSFEIVAGILVAIAPNTNEIGHCEEQNACNT